VQTETLANVAMSPLFQATVEATQEAIYNAILKATTVTSSRGTIEAIDVNYPATQVMTGLLQPNRS
jgi:D-aminopeptidase